MALGKILKLRIGNQQRFSIYYAKGVRFGTDRAQRVVGFAVDLATKGVGFVATDASNAARSARCISSTTSRRSDHQQWLTSAARGRSGHREHT